MKTEEAYKVLGLDSDASEAVRHNAFRQLQGRLEAKISKAPTPGLKEKYRASLVKLEEAIEVIELAADGGDLPMLRPDYEGGDEGVSVEPAAHSVEKATSAKVDQTVRGAAQVTVKKSKSTGGNVKEILIAVLVVLLLIGAGTGWWLGYESPRRAEAGRLVDKALHLEEKGKLRESMEVFEKALTVKSGWKEALDGVDRVQGELDRLESSQQRDQERQAADQSRDLDRLLVAARLAQSQEKWVDALAGFQKAMRIAPKNVEAAEAVVRLEKLLANARGSVVVKTEPGGATVRLGGKGEDITPANYVDLKLGSYTVEVEKTGYDLIKKEVVVRKDQTSVLGPLRLNRSEGALVIKSEPEGVSYTVQRVNSDVQSDEAFELRRGSTPAVESDLPTGVYQVVMNRSGWPDFRRNVKVKRDEKLPVSWAFSQGVVDLVSTPSGSEVFQSSGGQLKKLGVTPRKLNSLPVGDYTFVMRRNGWSDIRKTVRVSKGEAAQFHGEFSAGVLSISSSPSGCAYEIVPKDSGLSQLQKNLAKTQADYKVKGLSAQRNRDLKQRIATLQSAIAKQQSSQGSLFRGQTPAAALSLPTGDYQVLIKRAGWPQQVKSVSIAKGETQKVSHQFIGGSVVIESQPSEAALKLSSGASLGKSPYRGELPPGNHSVTLSMNGYQSKTVKLNVQAGQKTQKSVNLEKVKVVAKMPTGRFSGTVIFSYADGKKLVSSRTLTVGSSQSQVTLSSFDYFSTNPGKKYRSRLTVFGKFSGNTFTSSRQNASSTDYPQWLSESMRLKFSSDGKKISISASFREQGSRVSGSGTLSQ